MILLNYFLATAKRKMLNRAYSVYQGIFTQIYLRENYSGKVFGGEKASG